MSERKHKFNQFGRALDDMSDLAIELLAKIRRRKAFHLYGREKYRSVVDELDWYELISVNDTDDGYDIFER